MRGRDVKTGRFIDPPVPEDPLRVKLDLLSLRIVEQLLGEETDSKPLTDPEIGLFKAVSNYYSATRRLPTVKVEDPDEDGFGALKERLNAGNGETAADC
jgi:hypothetical protein